MTRQLIIGYTTEGTTDTRFLESIIQRTFEEVALECTGQIEVLPVQYLQKEGGDLKETASKYLRKAIDLGVMVFCIHRDSDDRSDENVFKYTIIPLFEAMENHDNIASKNVVAIVPVQMIEAWMLADTELLKSEIGTSKSDAQLGLNRSPERIANPKQTISNAILIARADMPQRRRRELKIGELYQPIGQKIQLDVLKRVPSYLKFREAVREVYRKLNYLT